VFVTPKTLIQLHINTDLVTDEQRKEFSTDHEKYQKFRKAIEADGNAVHELGIRGSNMQNTMVDVFRKSMKERLAKKPELIEHFTPTFGIGCRRLTPAPGFIEAIVEPNVDFIRDEISHINPTGIELQNGRKIDLDVLVCATGFETSSIPPYPVVGTNGTLRERFTPHAESYLSIAVDGFPNFFFILGPNSGIGAGSLTILLEGEGDYIIKCIRKLQKEDYVSMVPKAARVRDFSAYVFDYFKRTVYMDDCKSWYKSPSGDRITILWPGSSLHALECFRSPRWEDFDYETNEENRLRWLGNGWSVSLTGGADPAWYIADGFVDQPLVGTPENDTKLETRPFSN